MARLSRIAQRLQRNARLPATCPAIWFVTDPKRTPDPVEIARHLPRGAGIVHRHFGERHAIAASGALADIAAERGLVLLIAADETLAERVGAAGVHLPEWAFERAPLLRFRRPDWLMTGAAHSLRAAHQIAPFVDVVFVSPVFSTRSAGAGRLLGALRLAQIVRACPRPAIALGGVNVDTAPRLLNTGASGLAAADGLVHE